MHRSQSRIACEPRYSLRRQLGTPTEETWPGVSMLPEWHDRLPRFPAKRWSKRCSRMIEDPLELDLLEVS